MELLGPCRPHPSPSGEAAKSPPAAGRSKEEGAGPQPASGTTHAFLPLWFCSSSCPHQGIPFLQVLFILPGPPPLGSPAQWPQGIFPLLLSSTCLFTQPSGAHFLAKEAEKCYNGAVDENMLEAYGREPVTPTRGGVQGGFLEEGHWHLGCEGGIGVQCREKDEKVLQAKKRGYTGADCRSFL